ncbi:MAG: class I SAM-dependent methyltransferase [Elusimicrobia bacterium]|nr:class I SAM-dependent methyltransferase [Elusimicrobiota bacterium]
MTVLEVGSGTGVIAREIAPKIAPGAVVGIDTQPEQIRKAKSLAEREAITNVEFHLGNAEHLEFPSGSFDLVYCRFLLEHVPEPLKVIKEMFRVAKEGGEVVACECQVGCCSSTEPALPHAMKALNALYQFQKLGGGNPRIGDRLERLFVAAGMDKVKSDVLTFRLESTEEIHGYALGGCGMVKASEKDILKEKLIARAQLDLAYQEWERFAKTPGATAYFKLRRIQGNKV